MEHNCIYAKSTEGKKKKEGSATGKKKVKDYEYVTTYYCKGLNRKDKSCSCGFEMKIVRVKDGLIALQKCDIIDGARVPIEHNTAAHDQFESTGQRGGKESPKKLGLCQYPSKNSLQSII